jgi:hypothetical protein
MTGNWAEGNGGAIGLFENAMLNATDVIVSGGFSLNGGCIFHGGYSTAQMSNLTVTNCSALSVGGGVCVSDFSKANYSDTIISHSWSGSVGSGFLAQDFTVLKMERCRVK